MEAKVLELLKTKENERHSYSKTNFTFENVFEPYTEPEMSDPSSIKALNQALLENRLAHEEFYSSALELLPTAPLTTETIKTASLFFSREVVNKKLISALKDTKIEKIYATIGILMETVERLELNHNLISHLNFLLDYFFVFVLKNNYKVPLEFTSRIAAFKVKIAEFMSKTELLTSENPSGSQNKTDSVLISI